MSVICDSNLIGVRRRAPRAREITLLIENVDITVLMILIPVPVVFMPRVIGM